MSKIMLPITYDNAEKVIMKCREYDSYFDVDLKVGRYVIDAFSYLGVMSLCNHTVQVKPVIAALKDTIDNEKVKELFEELKLLGAYEEDQDNENCNNEE